MKFGMTRLPIAAVALAALTLTSFSASAAMPVTSAIGASQDSTIIQVAKKKKRMSRQQEIDRSVDSGTVPSRYRRSVPREYQQYIPFSKQ